MNTDCTADTQLALPHNVRRNAMLAASTVMLFLCILLLARPAEAQIVSHPLSEITTTVRYYSYDHVFSATEMKVIRYMIVRASNGEVKTVFDACDVCYRSNKGYSQSGSEVRCNNCGNRFAIDALGDKNTSGTCNPGYLPHSIDDDQIVLQISDLITGAYYFPAQTITSADGPPLTSDAVQLVQNRQELTITLPQEGHRTYRVYGIDGRLCQTVTAFSRSVRIGLAGLAPGAYILFIAGTHEMTATRFLIL